MEKVVIIGASSAGLACAARLKKSGIPFRLLERQAVVANAWRNHYDRLHLHTNKGNSELPFMKYPADVAKYPPKKEVIRSFEKYVEELGLEPEFNTGVSRLSKDGESWLIETNKGLIHSEKVIVCTGNTNKPRRINKPGMESFPGKIIHSSQYKNGKEFEGQNVLVIGFGNSACEIAIDLHEHGARPALSVRSAVNVIPRDIFGIPVLAIGIVQGGLPPRLTDTLNKPLLRWLVGDIEKYGLKKLPYGPREQIIKYNRIPLLDIGTMDLIKKGAIKVYGDITEITSKEIHFEDDKEDEFDAIIMATGYTNGLEEWIDHDHGQEKDIYKAASKREFLGKDGLYFCGYYVSPTGMIREVNIESKVICKDILNLLKK